MSIKKRSIHVAGLQMSFLFLLAGCGAPPPQETTPAATSENTEAAPAFDLNAAIQAEVPPNPVVAVANGTKTWNGAIEAMSPPVYAVEEDFTTFEVSIGTQTPVACIVYNYAINPAAALVSVMKSTTETAELKATELSSVVVINGTPAMLLEGLYTVEQNGQRAAGMLKLAVFDDSEHTLLCFHDELGYRESFRRIAFSFFESFKVTNSDQLPRVFNQIWLTSMQGSDSPGLNQLAAGSMPQTPVGFSREAVYCDEDNTCTVISSSAMILVSPAGIYSNDDVQSRTSDKKGILTEATFSTNENGESNTQLELKQIKNKSYSYEGKYRGTDIKGEFTTSSAKGLPGLILQKKSFAKQIATGKAGTVSLEEYILSVDATKPTTVAYELTPSDKGPLVAAKIGPLQLAAVADPAGNLISVEMTSGAIVLRLEQMLLEGTLPVLP